MKKFEWKSVLALALTGALALGLTACGSSDNGAAATGSNDAGSKAVYRTLDEIKESGTINIGVFSDNKKLGNPFPTFVFYCVADITSRCIVCDYRDLAAVVL